MAEPTSPVGWTVLEAQLHDVSTHGGAEVLVAEHDDEEVDEVAEEHERVHVGRRVEQRVRHLPVELAERSEARLQNAEKKSRRSTAQLRNQRT